MDIEELKRKKKGFRQYLQKDENCHSVVLGSLMAAAEKFLPAIIKERFNPNFESLFDEKNSIEELIFLHFKMEEMDLAEKQAFNIRRCLNAYINYYCKLHDIDKNALFSEIKLREAQGKTDFCEGTQISSEHVRYERDLRARKACLDYFGYRCTVCGMDMEEKYGVYGHGFIEVHHIVPISKQGGEYKLDPIKHLRPLCPNCHAIIHRTAKHNSEKIMNVDEFKEYYNSRNL